MWINSIVRFSNLPLSPQTELADEEHRDEFERRSVYAVEIQPDESGLAEGSERKCTQEDHT